MDRRRSPGGVPPPPRRGERPSFPPQDHEMREGPPVREVRPYRGDPRDARERRRPRSQSPSYERYPPPQRGGPRMSPPPFKRYRQDDEYYNDRYAAPPSPEYGPPRSPPLERRRDDRMPFRDEPRGPPPRPLDPKEPLTFKQFLLREVDDDAQPEEAQARYQAYLTEFYGSRIRADFESKKNAEWMRKKYDTRFFEEALKRRNEEAQAAAKQFEQDLADGMYNPDKEGFNQGSDSALPPRAPPAAAQNGKPNSAADEAAPVEPRVAPMVCWRSARVAADYRAAKKLAAKLDEEKGITDNSLLPPPPAPVEKPQGNGADVEADEGEKAEKADMETDGGEGAGEEGGEEDEKPKEAGGAAEVEEGVAEVVEEGNVTEYLGKLDVLLTYLYLVHGVDYYAGEELDAEAYEHRLEASRVLRGPCPEEGEEPDADAEKADLIKLEAAVDGCWEKRLTSGDPLEVRCLRGKIEEEVEQWVQDQVVKHDEKKWGNKLSTKMFMAEHFVIKHVKNKHADAVTKAKEEILMRLYFENFKAAREAEQRRLRQQRLKASAAANGGRAGEEFFEEGPGGFEGFEGEGGEFPEGPFPGRGMRSRGRGRGMRGMGRRGPPMMHMDGPMMPPMMGMPGPMLVPAPGAGPMGPFILAPMPAHHGHGPPMPMDMDMVPYGGGGRRGGRGGRGGRGRGGGFGMAGPGAKLDPRGIREYYDLDAPAHNRAVLDYSDL